MIEGLASLLSGGITGILGGAISNIFDFFKERAQRKHEIEMRKLDLDEMDREYKFQRSMAEAEHEHQIEEKSIDLQQESYLHDQAQYSKHFDIQSIWLKGPLVFVDLVRGLVRPILTGYLIWLVWDTRAEIQQVLTEAGVDKLNPAVALELYGSTVNMILYLSGTALAWWFGTRLKSKG